MQKVKSMKKQNTTQDNPLYNNKNKLNINSSVINNNNYFSKNYEESKANSLLGSIKILKEQAIKIKKMKSESYISNNNKRNKNNIKNNLDDNDEKEKIKKEKLAKLGKLFYNLNQENNIINAIKEQFLHWTNKNNLPERQYNANTFNDNCALNKKIDDNKNKKDNDMNIEEFDRKINILKKNLIIYCLKIKKNKKNNKNNESEIESDNEREISKTDEKDNEIQNENIKENNDFKHNDRYKKYKIKKRDIYFEKGNKKFKKYDKKKKRYKEDDYKKGEEEEEEEDYEY